MKTDTTNHICAKGAICFECFKAGMDRVKAKREAWAQRSLPFEAAAPGLSPREIAHRKQMLTHLANASMSARS